MQAEARHLRAWATLVLALSFAVAACGPGTDLDADGGPEPADAGGDLDSGLEPDSGTEADAGAGLDAGPASDAGADTDAGADAGAPPADAGTSPWLAFASNRTGDYELYLTRTDGTGLRQLTATAGFDLFPAWVPDASRLLFASNRSGAFQLYAQDLAGGAATLVSTGLHAVTAPAISPDGLRVAFEGRTSASAATDVYVMALAGGPVQQLTTHAANEAGPAWSADGSTLFFVSNRSGTYELFSMAADGTGQTPLTTGLDVLGRPAATTGRVAFARRGTDMKSQLVLLDLASATRTTVSAQSDGEPAFSPGGDRLVVTSNRHGNPELVTFDAWDGGSAARVTTHSAIDGTAAWSPRAF